MMTSVNVAKAKDNLSSLIEHALAGEQAIISRHGREVIEMRAIASAADSLDEMHDEVR